VTATPDARSRHPAGRWNCGNISREVSDVENVQTKLAWFGAVCALFGALSIGLLFGGFWEWNGALITGLFLVGIGVGAVWLGAQLEKWRK